MTTLASYILSSGGDPGNALRIPHMIGDNQAPKLSFLFTVEFGFRSMSADMGHKDLETITYDLKSASRPVININQEDINYYGYRAKVATKTNFGTVKLTFYEDSLNTSSDLFKNYMSTVSPLFNGDIKKSVSTVNDSAEVLGGGGGTTTIGPLSAGSEDGPIKYMMVNHHYLEGRDTKKVTTYTYINPKIETVELDELDMSVSNASTISIVFTAEGITVNHR